MELDYTALRFWFAVFVLVANTAIAVWAWWQSRHRATNERIAELQRRVEQSERKHARLEQHVHAQPGHADMSAMKDELSGLRADVKEMSGTMNGLNKAVDLMTEHLLNRGSK